jgi:hypothetical protein
LGLPSLSGDVRGGNVNGVERAANGDATPTAADFSDCVVLMLPVSDLEPARGRTPSMAASASFALIGDTPLM